MITPLYCIKNTYPVPSHINLEAKLNQWHVFLCNNEWDCKAFSSKHAIYTHHKYPISEIRIDISTEFSLTCKGLFPAIVKQMEEHFFSDLHKSTVITNQFIPSIGSSQIEWINFIKEVFIYLTPTKNYFLTPLLLITYWLVFVITSILSNDIFQLDNTILFNYNLDTTHTAMGLGLYSFINPGIGMLLIHSLGLILIGVRLEYSIGTLLFSWLYIMGVLIAFVVSLYIDKEFSIVSPISGILILYAYYGFNVVTKKIPYESDLKILLVIGMYLFICFGYSFDNQFPIVSVLAVLIAGIVSGLLIPFNDSLKQLTWVSITSATYLSILFYFYTTIPVPPITFPDAFYQFTEFENNALKYPDSVLYKLSASKASQIINDSILINWQKAEQVLTLANDSLSDQSFKKQNLLNYCRLQHQYYTILRNDIVNESSKNKLDLIEIRYRISKIIQ